MNKKKTTAETFQYKAQMRQLLDIITHSLYTHPEVFLRELISNASDALNKARFKKLTFPDIRDADIELDIRIEVDEKKKTFSILDTGIGMTKTELIDSIGTVARSGTLDFLEKAKESGATLDENLIGKFGVGFYSVFMVTDLVTIETTAADKDAKTLRFQSKGEGEFTIEEIKQGVRGTKITFTFKESAKNFSNEYAIEEIIKKYSNFVDFPILLKNKKINTVSALWHKNPKEVTAGERNEFYKFLTNDFDEPLGFQHVSLEGDVNFKALIFIPKTAPLDLLQIQQEKSLHLYSNKILIQNDCKDLLPEYLRFIKGVIDTEDLPLNVSREVTQNSPVMQRIRKTLIREVFSLLKDLSTNRPEDYALFYKNFGPLLKVGITSDFENRDKIIELLRFETTLTQAGTKTSLKEYVARMPQEQKEMYYLSGEHRNSLDANPNLEYFQKNGLEVLLLSEPVDIFTVPSIGEYESKKLVSIEKADIDVFSKDSPSTADDSLTGSLLSLMKDILKEKVQDVVSSKRLVDSAVTLVSAKDAPDAQMERVMKVMDKGYTRAKKVMEVNGEHPLIKNLSKMYMADAASPLLSDCIEQLYEGALLMEGDLSQPASFLKRMTQLMQEATK